MEIDFIGQYFKSRTPQQILDDLVNGYNGLEFSRACEHTFKQMEYYKIRINDLLKEYPELQAPYLKTYTW